MIRYGYLFILLLLLLAPSPVQADGGKIYLPVITVDKPNPYNINAQDAVLTLSDMPAGYSLSESEPVSGSFVVSGWSNQFLDDSVFSSTFGVRNILLVYQSQEDATTGFFNLDLDDYSPISVPQLGDRTKGFTQRDGDFRSYVLIYQDGNVVSVIFTGAFDVFADFNDSYDFLELSHSKVMGLVAP